MKIIAVVVTYNRLELLKRNLDCLKRQETPLAAIVVVDNGATDGTHEWLDTQAGLVVVHQENVGGSGGFHTGMQRAFGMGADWIWCMDDDVFPRPDCLSRLMDHAARADVGILAPRRLMEGRVYTNDFLGYNLSRPFASMYEGRLAGVPVDGPTEIGGTAFEGLCVRREVVERVGLPNKDLFHLLRRHGLLPSHRLRRLQDTLCARCADGQGEVLLGRLMGRAQPEEKVETLLSDT